MKKLQQTFKKLISKYDKEFCDKDDFNYPNNPCWLAILDDCGMFSYVYFLSMSENSEEDKPFYFTNFIDYMEDEIYIDNTYTFYLECSVHKKVRFVHPIEEKFINHVFQVAKDELKEKDYTYIRFE